MEAPQVPPGSPSPATQLEFTQAMTDFKIMFPDMDVDVIEAVLRSNNGAVDTTIDQLLAMSADNEVGAEQKRAGGEEGVCSSPPPAYPNNLPSYKEAVKLDQDTVSDMLGASSLGGGSDLLSSMGASGGDSERKSGLPLHQARGWRPPLLGRLPSDFLRLGGRPGRSGRSRTGHAYTSSSHQEQARGGGGCVGGLSQGQVQERLEENTRRLSEGNQGGCQQMLEDEKFALMLQNEEFMTELRGNSEFLSSLEEEQLTEHSKPTEQGARKPHLGMDDAIFREKLKNMGKTSRAKFARLASKFRGGGAGKLLGHAPAPSKDNLLLNAEPLVNQKDSDTEGEEEQHSTTKGRKYQLM